MTSLLGWLSSVANGFPQVSALLQPLHSCMESQASMEIILPVRRSSSFLMSFSGYNRKHRAVAKTAFDYELEASISILRLHHLISRLPGW